MLSFWSLQHQECEEMIYEVYGRKGQISWRLYGAVLHIHIFFNSKEAIDLSQWKFVPFLGHWNGILPPFHHWSWTLGGTSLYFQSLQGAYIVLMPVEVQITLIPNNDTRRSAEALKSSGLPVNLTAALVSYWGACYFPTSHSSTCCLRVLTSARCPQYLYDGIVAIALRNRS